MELCVVGNSVPIHREEEEEGSSSLSCCELRAALGSGRGEEGEEDSSSMSSCSSAVLPEELFSLRDKLERHAELNEELRALSVAAQHRRSRGQGSEEEARRAEALVADIEALGEEIGDCSDTLWALHEAVAEHECNEARMEEVERRHVELFAEVHCEEDLTEEVREREAQLIDELAELEPQVGDSYHHVLELLHEFAEQREQEKQEGH